MRVLICDPTDPESVERMRAAEIEVDVRDDISAEELMEVLPAYDGMVVRSRTKVRAPLIDKAENLKVIVRGGVGLDNIDVEHARAKGITVLNTPAASSASVAELTIGYLFALARRIPDATASMRAGQWEKKAFSEGTEIAGKTLGLVGCGRIGQEVARRAAALGMNVIFTRRTPTELPYARQVSLDELVRTADYISLHVPHTPETHHIIGAPEFAKMKDGVYIINCGRGGTLDEEALYDAIVSGKVAGAALDVFADEKEDRGKKLFTLPQVIGSPHIGAGTVEATERVGAEVAELLINFYRENYSRG
ncbi:MAG: D-2-hydroxyacid dehydrogenase [Anaerolineae bacterium]|nr:D-2-hydroxyacid dehydrogenase [Anaerolineae bacterium]